MVILEKAKEIKKIIEESSSVYITAHKFLDLDALGSSIGIYEYAKKLNKKPVIIINDKRHELAVKRVLENIETKYSIKRSSKIKDRINNKSLLVVVDTNKEELLQDPTLLELFDNVLVIDHHETTKASIKKGLLVIDERASSACEMVTYLLMNKKANITKDVATILLSGIVLDTNNYILKTSSETFKASSFLMDQGAEISGVQSVLKQDLQDFVSRIKVITNAKTYKKVAISTAKSSIHYRREDLAKISDALLQFNNITTSFVIGKLDKTTTGISARSMNENVDVGKILSLLGGGGNHFEAGARIEKKSIKEVEQELKNKIKEII